MRDEKSTSVRFSQQERSQDRTVEVYRCRVPVEELEGTGRDDVKFCGYCAKSVYRVQGIGGFFDMVAAGQCVWVEPQDYLNSGCAPLLGSPAPPFDPMMLDSVEMLGIGQPIVQRLKAAGICLIGVLVQMTEMVLLKKIHLAPGEIKEIESVLGARGLALGMRLEGWPIDDFEIDGSD